MGSNLVGKDISLEPGTEAFVKAVEDWKRNGRPTVEKLLKAVGLRPVGGQSVGGKRVRFL